MSAMSKQERATVRALRSRVRQEMPELVERLLVIAKGHDWAAVEAGSVLLAFAYSVPRRLRAGDQYEVVLPFAKRRRGP